LNHEKKSVNKTGYFTHPACLLHEMGEGHPECPERLAVIHDHLTHTGLYQQLQHFDAPAAALSDLELAHDRWHIAALRGMTDTLRDDIAAGGPTHTQVDPDTSMNLHTWDAALHAAGAGLAATDAVIAGELQSAFCAVRPPGHHACKDHAMGFCFLNNVAVAARYALERHGLKRVAIVDFDVHHGNGTEDIVATDQRILMLSFFQHPFYPYGGARSNASNLLNLPVPAHTRGDLVRRLVREHWLPRLEAFQPEMLFISAGFDAHRDDDMGQMGLIEEDYAWMTRKLRKIAVRYAQGRIVSMLEGGYNLPALARSVQAHLQEMVN
jgi:acetoin utilization deacetylase AcuC-like enzyme